MSGTNQDFYAVLSAAIDDILEHGFDSAERVDYWAFRIREAAVRSLVPEYVLAEQLQRFYETSYRRLVDQGTILRAHPGVSRFTLEKVKPRLRAELDRRRSASVNLIKLNRVKMVEDVNQRFRGWASSVPPGGTEAAVKKEVKDGIRKSLKSLPFTERRVHIDQAHKFVSNLNNILATDSGAIAAIWHSHWRQKNYHYRKDHKERDEKVFVIPDNWALAQGLMKLAGRKYTTDVTAPGEEVYCRCSYQYIYSLVDLPADMLTEKGRDAIRRAKAIVA